MLSMTNAPHHLTAWDLIGFGGNLQDIDADAPDCPASVRIVGGHRLYEAVDFNDSGRQRKVRLARLVVTADGIRQVNRYVEPNVRMEVVPDKEGSEPIRGMERTG